MTDAHPGHDCSTQHSPDRYCPKCGGRLERRSIEGDPKRRPVCTECLYIHYVNPKLAACTVPIQDGRVLLLRRDIEPARNKWVFPGGFVDRDEALEQAAARETLEEVAIEVRVGPLIGLYSEQLGRSGEHLGNFPQAFTHQALIGAAYDLDRRLDQT